MYVKPSRYRLSHVHHIAFAEPATVSEAEAYAKNVSHNTKLLALMCSRPNSEVASKHVLPRLSYWQHRTKEKLEIFCLGYTRDKIREEKAISVNGSDWLWLKSWQEELEFSFWDHLKKFFRISVGGARFYAVENIGRFPA